MNGTTAMRFSDADIEAARATLRQAHKGEAVPIIILTDEEVTILDGIEHEQLVPTPWLDQQEDADRSLLGRVALRSLLAREMVRPVTDRDGQVKIEAHPGITGPLVLRRSAQAILTLERTSTGGKHWAFAYLHEEEGATTILEEEISAAGHHSFTVYPAEIIGQRLERILDPNGMAATDDPPWTLTAAELEAQAATLPELRDAIAVSALTAIPREKDLLLNATVYASPHGVYVLHGTERHDGDEPVTYSLSQVSSHALRALPTELITT